MSAKSGTEQFGQGDLGIANYALTLEYLEADFYAKVDNSGMLKGKVADLAKRFGNEEQAHVDALIALIKKAGGKPAVAPKTNFPLDDEKSILKLAATVENLGARAYLGQAGEHPGQGDPGRRPVDPLGRGAPRRGPQPRHGRQAGARCLRQAGDGRRGPEDRQAVPGHLAPKGLNPNGEHRDPGHEPGRVPGPRRPRHRRRLRRRVRHPVGDRRAGAGRGWGRRRPQLRADARVPRGRLLQAGRRSCR